MRPLIVVGNHGCGALAAKRGWCRPSQNASVMATAPPERRTRAISMAIARRSGTCDRAPNSHTWSAEDSLIKASQRIGTDPTVQDHLGDLYQKTGRLKLAAAHWERALSEWNKTVAAEVDQNDVARVQKKLESAKMKLAKEDSDNK